MFVIPVLLEISLLELHKELHHVHILLDENHRVLEMSVGWLGFGDKIYSTQDPDVEVFDFVKSLVSQDVVHFVAEEITSI